MVAVDVVTPLLLLYCVLSLLVEKRYSDRLAHDVISFVSLGPIVKKKSALFLYFQRLWEYAVFLFPHIYNCNVELGHFNVK